MIRILVVDDEVDLQLLIKQKFRKQILSKDYEFFFAQNGVQALSLLETHTNIDLIISDINMPEMDGLTLLGKVSNRNPKILTVIISAYGDMGNIRTAMNLGAFDFVTKPINFLDLNITIEKALGHIEIIKNAEETKEKLNVILNELNVASNIQQSILPKEFISNPHLDLYAFMKPAREIGGDFYDFFWINPETLGLVIADVSGKGVPAALFMTVSRTLLRAHALNHESPSACVTEVNKLLAKENENMMFVTLFYAQLRLKTGELVYTNAGHNPPFLIRSGQVEFIPNIHGMPLGITENYRYQESVLPLMPEDLLFLYTDGLPEGLNASEEFFKTERIQKELTLLFSSGSVPSENLVSHMQRTIEQFSIGAPQSDDITMLGLRYLKPIT